MQRWASASFVIVVIGLAVGVLAARRAVTQPIAFNHRKHTQDLKLDCELCHPYVKTGHHPGLPSTETCAMCHQSRQGTSHESAKVTEYVASGRPLVFHKLFSLPTHVFYTHRRHVGIANLACRNCHGDIALTTTPPRRPLVTIKMQVCLNCHLKMHQTTDCIGCHR